MNNKGQTLVLFIIFIPILIILAAFIIDTGLIIRESTRLKAATKTVIKDTYYKEDLSDEKIIKLLNKNNINTDSIEITIYNDQITINNNYDIESIFGKLIGLKEYEIKYNVVAKTENNKLKFIKE